MPDVKETRIEDPSIPATYYQFLLSYSLGKKEIYHVEEFKEFVLRGNVVDMAVGIIIGAAFGLIIKSLVDDILMPPIGFILGGVDFSNLYWTLSEGSPPAPYTSLGDTQVAGAVTIIFGLFINSIVIFLIIASPCS